MDVGSSGDDTLRSTSPPLLVVKDLRTEFVVPSGMLPAVDGVSFEVSRGKTLGIVGESGSGKTVLSRSVMQLKPPRNAVITGSVVYNGVELIGLPGSEVRKLWGVEMAMIFQDPMTALNPVLTIGEQLTEHVRHHLKKSKREARLLGIELLRRIRIPDPVERFDSYPHALSGGMRQRVCVAMALACNAHLLFADEPTTALDVTVQHQILNLLAQQQRERSMAMILITHDLGVVAGRTDETAVMYAGRFVEVAPTMELFSNVRHPYTQALLRSIPRITDPNHTRLTAIDGLPPDLIDRPIGCAFAPRCPRAQQRCRHEAPPLEPAGVAGHMVACWFPVDVSVRLSGSSVASAGHHDPLSTASI